MKNLNFYSLDASNNQTLRMIVNESGNVGIGTSIANTRLAVAGDISFNGNLYQNGALFTGGSTIDETTDVSLNSLLVHGDLSANDASFNVIDISAVFIQGRDLVDGAPNTLNTLNKLAIALDNSANFATNVTADISSIQSQLDTKQDTITDGDLTIAFTNGLQSALDSKHPNINETTDVSLNSLLVHGDLSANDASFNVIDISAVFIQGRDLVDGAPNTLNTLNKLAIALDNSANFATNVTADISSIQSQLDTKQDTITDGDLTIAFTNGLQSALDSKHPLINETTDVSLNNLLIHGDLSANDASFNVIDASSINTTGTSYMHSIIPAADNTYSLGDPSNVWKDVYIGPGSLYIDGQKVLESDANTIVVGADENQNLKLNTTGSGVLQMESASGIQITSTGSGNIELGSTGTGIVRITDNLALNGDIEIYNDSTNTVKINDSLNVTGDYLQNGANINTIYATLASPTLTGTPLAPTATSGTNTTQIATTAFVASAVSNLVNSAPAALDTLSELAAALDNSANFATNVTTTLGDLQTQINAKQATITTDDLAITDISGLTASLSSKQSLLSTSNRLDAALIHDGTVTNTEFGYLDGVTSAIQTQLDSKTTSSSTDTFTNKTIDVDATGNSITNIANANIKAAAGIEYSKLSIADADLTIAKTSGLQAALDAKQATITTDDLDITDISGLTASLSSKQSLLSTSNRLDAALIHDGTVSNTEFGYLDGVTSAIQTQLNAKITASSTDTLTNKTLTTPVISTISNTGTLTLPTSTGTIALTSDIPTAVTNNNQLTNGAGYITASSTDTLTNKTLTTPVISTISNTGTLTLPTSTGTIALTSDIPTAVTNNNQLTNGAGYITASSTDTLTNKTIDVDATGNSITNIANANIKAAAGIVYSKLSIADADLTIAKTSGLQAALDAKQATLTAGTNITITGNTISASGGSGLTDLSATSISDLSDVSFNATTTTDGATLAWNTSEQLWKPSSVTNTIGVNMVTTYFSTYQTVTIPTALPGYHVSELDLTIKPMYNDSIIEIKFNVYGDFDENACFRIKRNNDFVVPTTDKSTNALVTAIYDNNDDNTPTINLVRWYDTPNTTDSITYKLYINRAHTSNITSYINGTASNVNDWEEQGISTASVIEHPKTKTLVPATSITKQGQILETLAGVCDGRTVVVESGSYTLPNVTTYQNASTTLTDINGSSIDYTPPSTAKQVIFDYHFTFSTNTGDTSNAEDRRGIFIVKFYIDNTEVEITTLNWGDSTYSYGDEFCFKGIIDIGSVSSDDIANGKLASWTSNKNLKLKVLCESGGWEVRIHANPYYNLPSAGYGVVPPRLQITAIGESSGQAVTLTNNSVNDLSDISFNSSSTTDGQALVWNSTDGVWEAGNSSSSPWTTSSSDIYYDSGNVGIGTTSPEGKLHVVSTNIFDGIRVRYSATNPAGVYMGYGGISSIGNTRLRLGAGNTEYMCIHPDGYVGIGTNSPVCPLEITTETNLSGSLPTSLGYFASNGSGSTLNFNNHVGANISIKAVGSIWSARYCLVGSDRRIKTNIVDVSDNQALSLLRNIPCRYYEYKDKVSRGIDNTIGFIAQEVREHLPMAVDLQREIIPNEYRTLTDISWNNTTLYTDLSDCSGVKYRFYVSNDLSGNGETMKEVMGNADNSFTFDQSYNNVFCYGREVNDFHTLDKQKLFALNFSATQELDRIIQSQQTTIQTQQTTLEEQQNEIEHLKLVNQDMNNQLNTLNQQNQQLQQDILLIKQHLNMQ